MRLSTCVQAGLCIVSLGCGSAPPQRGQPATAPAASGAGEPQPAAAPKRDDGPGNGVFELVVRSAKVPAARPDGKPWSSSGPKPYVVVEVGPARYLSEPVTSSDPKFEFKVVVHVEDAAQPVMRLQLWNAGLRPDDVICKTELRTTDVLRAGGELSSGALAGCDALKVSLERVQNAGSSLGGERTQAVGAAEPDDGLEIAGTTGSIDEMELNSTIQSNGADIRNCYAASGAGKAGRGGQLVVAFMVDKAGHASDLKAAEDSIGDQGLIRCLGAAVGHWKFPRAKGGKAAVSFPVQFH